MSRVKDGEIPQFHIEDNHKAIIDPLIWEAVQFEQERRDRYIAGHGTNSYSHRPETNPFAGKVICGTCRLSPERVGKQAAFTERCDNAKSDIGLRGFKAAPTAMQMRRFSRKCSYLIQILCSRHWTT